MKRKILLIKLEAPVYSSLGMESAFSEYFEVHTINWQHINFTQGYEALWPHIVTTCLEVMPDIIFCQFQKPVLNLQQFKTLAKYGFVINYTEDVRENIFWMEEAAPHIGLTIFTNMDDCEKLWNKGIDNVAYMMVSYNHLWYKFTKPEKHRINRHYGEIVFIGNNFVGSNLNFPLAQERQDMIAYMKKEFGARFQSYGLGQENQILQPPQVVEAYNNAKIVITHSNFKRKGYTSDRNLCALGCGAMVIQQHFEGIEDMFEGLKNLYSWHTFEDIGLLCRLYLSLDTKHQMSEEDKQQQAEYIRENHSWQNRVKVVMAFIKLMPKTKLRIHEFD